MRARTLLAGLVAGVLTSGLLAVPAGAAPPIEVVELPISFAVKNTNRTTVPCASDGKDYTVNGVIVGPKEAITAGGTTGGTTTLWLHAVTWTSDYFNLDIAGHNFVRSLASLGHVSVAVDRLGYGTSGKPEGLATCFGSEADVAGQMVDALRSGTYTVRGGPARAYNRVNLGGSSVGAMIANIAAYTFHNVDGLVNQGFGDFAASPYAAQEVFDAYSRCSSGGDPGSPKDYATFAKDSRDTFYFHDATEEVRAGVPAASPDPCGQIQSVLTGIGSDMARLGEIDVPVMLVFGRDDAVYPAPAADLTAPRYFGSPEVTASGIPNASHFPILGEYFGMLVNATDVWLKSGGFGDT